MTVCRNGYLSLSEMTENAEYILSYLSKEGYTKNAICGILGNMQSESTINPCIWEGLHSYDSTPYLTIMRGYGLVQWTPFNKYTKWARDRGWSYKSIMAQCERIIYEVEQNIQWINSLDPKNRSFKEFMMSTDSPNDLAMAFIKAYERPQNPDQPNRGTQADYWYTTLTGGTIIPPDEKPPTAIKSEVVYHLWLSNALKWG
jgi:tail lysozyme